MHDQNKMNIDEHNGFSHSCVTYVTFLLCAGRSGRLVCVVLLEKTFQEGGQILQGLVSDKIADIVQGAAHFAQPDEQPVCLLLRAKESYKQRLKCTANSECLYLPSAFVETFAGRYTW